MAWNPPPRPPAPHVQAAIQRCQAPRPTAPALPAPAIQPRLADSLRTPAPPRPPAASLPSRIIQGFFQGGRPRLPMTPGVILPCRGHAVQVPAGISGLSPHGTGERLPQAVQAKMEAFFGASFADVRVHVGPQPAALGAVAFTQGSDIFFAHGQYAPATPHGQRLLAHELTHVVQQRSGQVRNPFGGGTVVVHDPGLEAEAERRGALIAHFQPGAVQASPAPAPRVPAAAGFGVLQMGRGKPKIKSKATIGYGSENQRIKPITKFSSSKIGGGDTRVKNVRGPVRHGNKRGRKSTTRHKTTDTSFDLNAFLRDANLLTRIVRFEGGHLIADRYGGPTSVTNTVPLPHTFNCIAYKKEENQLNSTLTNQDTTMEVSILYPDDELEGFLTPQEQKTLERNTSKTQVDRLRDLFCNIPEWIAWEVNNSNGGQQHDWTEFDDIRKDIFPRGMKPKNLANDTDFIDAVNNL
ncbi:MAG: DUF4157 domain-containing protein [Thermoanaerobaculia bacterium]